MILIGNIAFCVTSVLPPFLAHEDMSAQVNAQKDTINTQSADQQTNTNDIILEQQVQSAQEKLNNVADNFLKDDQVEGVIDRLYEYATASKCEITSLQANTGDSTANDAYNIRILRLEVSGTMPALINFVTLIREASMPVGVINNLNVSTQKGQTSASVLSMDLLLYTSPLASGSVIDRLLATSTSTPTPTIHFIG